MIKIKSKKNDIFFAGHLFWDHPHGRSEALRSLIKRDDIKKIINVIIDEHEKGFNVYDELKKEFSDYDNGWIENESFLKIMSESKFSLSLFGNWHTGRFMESLSQGSIPICENIDVLDYPGIKSGVSYISIDEHWDDLNSFFDYLIDPKNEELFEEMQKNAISVYKRFYQIDENKVSPIEVLPTEGFYEFLNIFDEKVPELRSFFQQYTPYDIFVENEMKYIYKSKDFVLDKNEHLKNAVEISKQNNIEGLSLEFGVGGGHTINVISSLINNEKVYGFDSFNGLPEDWTNGFPKGTFSMGGETPNVNENVILKVGMFQKTLPNFLKKHNSYISFLHIDCDLYSSSKFVLEQCAKYIRPGTVIVFDEMIHYEDFKKHEMKSWFEFVNSYDIEYEYIGYLSKELSTSLIINKIGKDKKFKILQKKKRLEGS